MNKLISTIMYEIGFFIGFVKGLFLALCIVIKSIREN
jgi:uncharacterized protein YneF (UPF0154 family)